MPRQIDITARAAPRRATLLMLLVAGCAGGSTKATVETSARLLRAAEVDRAQLDGSQRDRLVSLARQTPCPCAGKGPSLEACAERGGKRCIRAPFAVRALVRGIVAARPDAEIRAALDARFGHRRPAPLDLRDRPCRGPEHAPAQLVVFSDFECPACAYGRKLIEAVERHVGKRLRVCFKNLPLRSIHPDAQLAAQAGVAAHLQGKFWQMHDLLYDNQRALGQPQLEQYARSIGLDAQRFAADLASDAVKARVEADLAEAIALGLRGTPTFFVNGRELVDPPSPPELLDWIAEAIALGRRVD